MKQYQLYDNNNNQLITQLVRLTGLIEHRAIGILGNQLTPAEFKSHWVETHMGHPVEHNPVHHSVGNVITHFLTVGLEVGQRVECLLVVLVVVVIVEVNLLATEHSVVKVAIVVIASDGYELVTVLVILIGTLLLTAERTVNVPDTRGLALPPVTLANPGTSEELVTDFLVSAPAPVTELKVVWQLTIALKPHNLLRGHVITVIVNGIPVVTVTVVADVLTVIAHVQHTLKHPTQLTTDVDNGNVYLL